MKTLGDISKNGAKYHAHKEAMVFEGQGFTYQALEDRTNRLANAFLSLGCRQGERVAILSENSPKFLEVYLGAAKAGLVVTPLNFRLAESEIVHIINDAENILLLVGDGLEMLAREIRGQVSGVIEWVSLNSDPEGFLSYETLLSQSCSNAPDIAVDENDMAILMYTGGTTGLPKGVMLSHKNLLAAFQSLLDTKILGKNDTTCMVLPLFHAAFWPAMCLLMVGGRVAIERRTDINSILKTIHAERCTHVNAVPTLYNLLVGHADTEHFDLSSLRSMTYAGSPMPIEVLKSCIEKFGNIFGQGYGMTEAAPTLTYLAAQDHVLEGPRSRLLASAGKAAPGIKIRIVDEDGDSLSSGDVGEVVASGENIMLGYWKNQKLTNERLRDGWLQTGDMGYLDEEGYLFLVDRKADMIITGGENVYPTETENVLYQHPAVFECAVTSVPDEKWVEKVQAVVVLKPDAKASGDELIQFCKQRLAGYKCPKNVFFRDQLPKSAIGKILRNEIKKSFGETAS